MNRRMTRMARMTRIRQCFCKCSLPYSCHSRSSYHSAVQQSVAPPLQPRSSLYFERHANPATAHGIEHGDVLHRAGVEQEKAGASSSLVGKILDANRALERPADEAQPGVEQVNADQLSGILVVEPGPGCGAVRERHYDAGTDRHGQRGLGGESRKVLQLIAPVRPGAEHRAAERERVPNLDVAP